MISTSGIRRSLEDRIVLCADCDATRTLSVLISGNLVCSTCGSDNWMHVPITASIKESFFIKGELRVEGDLTVDGRVEGRIDLGDHNLWVAPHGAVDAVVHAKNVIIAGALIGEIAATEMVEIRSSGSVEASIRCPRIVIADGAKFNGSIETDAGSDTASKRGLQKRYPAKMAHTTPRGRVQVVN
jgi:cytoskeletal protein CcmA (bactofilin family)